MKNFSRLEEHLGYWMRLVSNNVSSSFRDKLEKHDVGVAEWAVLRRLYEQKMLSPGVIAEMTGLTRGAISKLLDRLVRKELIERLESSKDRRFQEVKLSQKGIRLLPQLASLADLNDDHFFGHLSKEEKKQLMAILKGMVDVHHWNQIPIS